MFDTEYTKREVREVACKEIAEKLGENWTLSEIKRKINNLRAQLGRELKKTKNRKSGQSKWDVSSSSCQYPSVNAVESSTSVKPKRQ